jgi:precorrin-6A/cobalt-precorrin-6A reductase
VNAAKRTLLILGGTSEGRQLAERAIGEFGDRLNVISSLAGRTADPVPVAGSVRQGGFGGAAGLAEYLRENGVSILVDATHPFADQISRNAAEAAAATGVKRLAIVRPPWRAQPGDRWIEVPEAAAAADAVRSLGTRIWLTLGTADIEAFAALTEHWFLVRRVDPPPEPLPLRQSEVLLARGPFALSDERRILAEHRIEAIVSRASGGAATAAKLDAAREAGIPVVMIARPPSPAPPIVPTVDAAMIWLRERLDA